ncbi:hypothetical protein GQ43DRAFT_239344 [Delitschia confertaspora ATCC 74209]|uniref:Uncharacterized protein n=1 Tax=Delitschia confertaspora ATCC 74209 TaxID=1513339 RepID=A0A9P4MV67_9PLEO|nr:hypothetical protein GQ43DRAFT_239344 [Delitschia confertaspora ATCC 74209]
MTFPQPFDNRRRQFRYEPRHGGQPALIYQLPDEAAAPAPAPAAQPGPAPAVQHVPYTLYIGLEYCGGVLGAYPYVQYYQYPATAAAPASAAAPTYVHYPHAHSYQAYFTNTTTQPAAGANGNTIYGQTAAEVQVNDRRLATQRGAYEAKPIKPVANPDDVFWCRERDGQWTLRPFYNIDNDLKPGRWTMDAEKGYCVYHRE